MLNLMDIVSLTRTTLGRTKIHFATGSHPTPLEAYFDGGFKKWQEHQNKKNFECDHILSLISLGGDLWLFAGIYAVEGVALGSWKVGECYVYSTREVKGLEHLAGKAIIQFTKPFRASYLRDPKYLSQLLIWSLRPERMSIGDFPGFKSVLLSFQLLKTVIREVHPSWYAALRNVAGVYLITDKTDGRQYVGSAYGGKGVWQRWSSYARTGHGGNKDLKALLAKKGSKHAENFQFFLLEVCDLGSADEYIIGRESHWKSVLKTREFGLNSN